MITKTFGRVLAAVIWIGATLPAMAAEPQPIAVDVQNKSVPTKCAEEDNISYTLSAPNIKSFSVTAVSPVYLPQVVRDITAPDFTNCTWWNPPPPKPFEKPYVPPTAVLYEDDQYILKGVVYPDFWRPSVVPVKVGNIRQNWLHLVQLWKKTSGGPLEFLVFYPQDGYWRLKPLPPFRMHEVAYGSSFLVGPVEVIERPFVAYKSVEFDPQTLTFTIEFAKGGRAKVSVARIEVDSASLNVTFDPPMSAALPFAGLRSMYVDPIHADTAETIVVEAPGQSAKTTSVIDYASGKAISVVFGRSVISTHNTSAPDIGFRDFKIDR